MATALDYIEFICDQIKDVGEVRYKKMFGEYMVYVNDKPIIIVCDNIPYVKKLECIEHLMEDAKTGSPYEGAKEHYVLDIDSENCKKILIELERVTPVPKSRDKKN